MADIVPIQGSQEQGKIRNPLGVIGLGIITLGIYSIVWYYMVNKEMAEVGQARGTDEAGTNPMTSLLAVFPGVLLFGIPTLVSYFKACGRLSATERVTGTQPGMEPALLFLLMLFISPVGIYIFQSNLNKALQQQAGGGGGQLPQQEAPQRETVSQ